MRFVSDERQKFLCRESAFLFGIDQMPSRTSIFVDLSHFANLVFFLHFD